MATFQRILRAKFRRISLEVLASLDLSVRHMFELAKYQIWFTIMCRVWIVNNKLLVSSHHYILTLFSHLSLS